MVVVACDLPENALLARYQGQRLAFTDCFSVQLEEDVTFEAFVTAFYTTWLFKLERWILAVAAKRPSTDADVVALARGQADTFAAWDVEARGEAQILLCDMGGRTRSWLMVEPLARGTRVYFGSAVVPVERNGVETLGFGFKALLGFHKLYSRALLSAAARRLRRGSDAAVSV